MHISQNSRFLRIEDLWVVYRQPFQTPLTAVQGVSFQIGPGESFGIVGESGCGKSSLARAIVGIQPFTRGRIWYNAQEIVPSARGVMPHAYRCQVQMVFQDAVGSLNPRMTVQQTLAEVIRVQRVISDRQKIADKIEALLELAGLPEHVLRAYPHELSGGQCQRVSLARCLALEPRLIIADEPVSALDVSVQARIINLLRTLQQQLGVALIFISHDLAVVRNLCSRMAVMSEGRFVESGDAAQIITAPTHPYTRKLIASVPDIDQALSVVM